MNMPVFTAEASLYFTSGRYRTSARHGTHATRNEVLPQLRKTNWKCFKGCRDAGGPYAFCDFICTDDEGGGVSVPSEPPEFVCGPCIKGRQRCGIPGVGFSSGPCIED
jgi:hypothetical protein